MVEDVKEIEVEIVKEMHDIAKKDTKIKQLAVAREQIPFDKLMDMSQMLSKSTIVPIQYQNRAENCFVALDLASRMGLSPMVVMQNLYVIQGKPSWSGQAVASMLRATPSFKNVELHYVGEAGKDTWGAYVTAIKVATGKLLTGATVTLAIAKKEGWFQKNGSKWQTMPEIMLAYRAHTWFGRVYAPELLMGLQSVEEIEDVTHVEVEVTNPYESK